MCGKDAEFQFNATSYCEEHIARAMEFVMLKNGVQNPTVHVGTVKPVVATSI